ncbi:MAG: tRNA pseudouridine(55) synthase TruB [Candidatus Eisenbacteria bacterium]
MNRVLVIDKPKGLTSHDVVARVRRLTRIQKVGHAGSLDPAATGVLVLLVGKATRLAQFFVDLDKRYHGRIVLGVTTDTQDATGKVEATADPSGITRAQIEDAFEAFEGETQQVPPMVSALKREGTPLYVLARRGQVVEREPRPVTITGLRVLAVELPEIEFEMSCSKGTYVRTLAADIGELLGCGAHLGELARTGVGAFTLEAATRLGALTREGISGQETGYSMHEALSFMPELRVTEREEDVLSTGGAIEVDLERLTDAGATLFRLSADGVELAAVGKRVDVVGSDVSEDGTAAAATPAARASDDANTAKVRIQPVRVFTEPV